MRLKHGRLYNEDISDIFSSVWKDLHDPEKRAFVEKLPLYILKIIDTFRGVNNFHSTWSKYKNRAVNMVMQSEKNYKDERKDRVATELATSLGLLRVGGRSALNAYRSRYPVRSPMKPNTKDLLKRISQAEHAGVVTTTVANAGLLSRYPNAWFEIEAKRKRPEGRSRRKSSACRAMCCESCLFVCLFVYFFSVVILFHILH